MEGWEFRSREAACAMPFRALSALPTAIRICPVGIFASAAAALGLAGCAQQPQYMHGKEYFPQSIYGQASPRVIAGNEPVPHGGGTYKVGRAYTVAGRTYYPRDYKRYSGIGLASWYGDAFHGRRTANGEIYDRNSISAAHPTMPLPSYARVTNLRNHYSIIVRVNDRGPFARDRIMDVSRRVAELLDFRRRGTTRIKVDYVGPASLAGSDDQRLAATLREDGRLAQIDRLHSPNLAVANATEEPADEVASGALGKEALGKEQVADAGAEVAAVFKGPMPLPPSRPFDLDTIPGADVPIAANLADR